MTHGLKRGRIYEVVTVGKVHYRICGLNNTMQIALETIESFRVKRWLDLGGLLKCEVIFTRALRGRLSNLKKHIRLVRLLGTYE